MHTPRLKAPARACDCHIHVYDDRFPIAPTALAKPPPQTDAARYRDVQRTLGLERAVVVQPTAYGFDNRCTLDTVAAMGSGARGVVVVPPDVTDEELARLTKAGVRGVRYFMLKGGLLPWESLEPMAARLKDHGWLVQIQLDGRDLPKFEALIARLPVPAIIDHNGKYLEPVPVKDPAFQSLLRLLGSGRVWAKLAAPYETSKIGPPHYDDVSRLARALVKTNPERCIWGSNWPHPGINPSPDNGAMLDLLLEWADGDATRHKILVDNPSALFGFDRTA